MPIYVYKCKANHSTERVVLRVSDNEPKPKTRCEDANGCALQADLVPARTGVPRLKTGKGGFYKPNA